MKSSKCRFCRSEDLHDVIDLGKQPLANAFSTSAKKSINLNRYDLKVVRCKRCNLCQLSEIVHWSEIYNNYSYLSSSSKPLVDHYKKLVSRLDEKYSIKNSYILDVGCNDGILLDCYDQITPKNKRVGVDPSSVAKLAKEKGYQVFNSPLNLALSEQIILSVGNKFKIITFTNVFAHIDDIHEIMKSLRKLMNEDTILIIEAPYLYEMLDNKYFDTIYHEHYSYLSLLPMLMLMEEYGFEIFYVEHSNIGASGPNLAYHVRFKTKNDYTEVIKTTIAYELKKIKSGIFDNYQKSIEKWKKSLIELIDEEVKSGGVIGCIGSPAKGSTLLNFMFSPLNNKIKFISEVNPIKINSYLPGLGIKIVSESEFESSGITLAILLTWNYRDFFIEKYKQKKSSYKLVVPLPELNVYKN